MLTKVTEADLISAENDKRRAALATDYAALGEKLARTGIASTAASKSRRLRRRHPVWGVGTGGTRFARFPGEGEPRHIFDKLDDCAVIQGLTGATPRVSLHIPWDRPKDPAELRDYAAERGLGFDAMNSNTFQDSPGQKLSYNRLAQHRCSLRRQDIEPISMHPIGRALGSRVTSGSATAPTSRPEPLYAEAFERYLNRHRSSWRSADDWALNEPEYERLLFHDRAGLGHQLLIAIELGPQAYASSLGHHAPTQYRDDRRPPHQFRTRGFHSTIQYGDATWMPARSSYSSFWLTRGDAELAASPAATPPLMTQSHNVTRTIESLMVATWRSRRLWAARSSTRGAFRLPYRTTP